MSESSREEEAMDSVESTFVDIGYSLPASRDITSFCRSGMLVPSSGEERLS